jgi:hypothetical protein
MSSLLSPFVPGINNNTVTIMSILNWRLQYAQPSEFIRLYNTVAGTLFSTVFTIRSHILTVGFLLYYVDYVMCNRCDNILSSGCYFTLSCKISPDLAARMKDGERDIRTRVKLVTKLRHWCLTATYKNMIILWSTYLEQQVMLNLNDHKWHTSVRYTTGKILKIRVKWAAICPTCINIQKLCCATDSVSCDSRNKQFCVQHWAKVPCNGECERLLWGRNWIFVRL